MFKDMFGEEIKVGNYLAYAELYCKTRAVQNIYRVEKIDKQLHCLCVESTGYQEGKTKRLQCSAEKAIILKDYKEDSDGESN